MWQRPEAVIGFKPSGSPPPRGGGIDVDVYLLRYVPSLLPNLGRYSS